LRAGRIATPTGNTWSSTIARAARLFEEAVPEPLTLDEPLVRCEFMRMESGAMSPP